MASSIAVEFAFEVGDPVYFRDASNCYDRTPRRFIVTERIAQQCHGGIQRLYRLWGEQNLVPEITLSADMPAYEPYLEGRIEDHKRMIGAERGDSWQSFAERMAKKKENKAD